MIFQRTAVKAALLVVLSVLATSHSFAANECGAAVANTATCTAATYPTGISYAGAAGSGFTLNLNAPTTGTTVTGQVVATSVGSFPTTYNLIGPVNLNRTLASGGALLGSATIGYGAVMNLSAQTVITLNRPVGTSAYSVFYPVSIQAAGGPASVVSAATITANGNTGGPGDRPFAVGISVVGNSGGANETVNVSSAGTVTVKTSSVGSAAGAATQGVVAYSIASNLGTPSPVVTTQTSTGKIVLDNVGRNAECFGLVAYNHGTGGAQANNSGPVTVTGDCENVAVGVYATGGTGPATATLTDLGAVSIDLAGSNPGSAVGVWAASGGLATVLVDADVTVKASTAPAYDSAAIYVDSTSTVASTAPTTVPAGTYKITVKSGRTASLLSSLPGAVIMALAPGGGVTDIESGATISHVSAAAANAMRGGDGADVANLFGSVTGSVALGLGNDTLNLQAGSLTGNIYGDAAAGASASDGNDTFRWTGGTWAGNFYGQNGSDTVTIAATAPWDGSNTLDGGDDVAAADGWVDVLNIQGQTVTTSAARLLNWERISLDGYSNLTLTGASLSTGTGVSGAQTLGLVINAGSTLTRAAPLLTVTGDILNQGRIVLADGTATLGALTLTGNYTGGGSVSLDVVLNAGGAATSADQLLITGNSVLGAGATTLNVTNVGGLGAATSGNGILLVQVSGSSAANAFVLPAPGYLTAGGYRYYLRQVNGNWFLQSSALAITKVMSVPAGLGPFDFTFTATCNLPTVGSTYTATLTGFTGAVGGPTTAEIPNVPPGATCTLAETLPATTPQNYRWATPVYDQPTQTVPASGVVTGTVTNALLLLAGPTVSKRSRLVDATTIEWTISVANIAASNSGQVAVAFTLTDTLPISATLISGSLSCAALGTVTQTTVGGCAFNAGNTTLTVTGTLAHASAATAAAAGERVDVVLRAKIVPGLSISNTACVRLTGQSGSACDTHVTAVPALPVPALTATALAALLLVMALSVAIAGRRPSRRRAA